MKDEFPTRCEEDASTDASWKACGFSVEASGPFLQKKCWSLNRLPMESMGMNHQKSQHEKVFSARIFSCNISISSQSPNSKIKCPPVNYHSPWKSLSFLVNTIKMVDFHGLCQFTGGYPKKTTNSFNSFHLPPQKSQPTSPPYFFRSPNMQHRKSLLPSILKAPFCYPLGFEGGIFTTGSFGQNSVDIHNYLEPLAANHL